FILIVQIFNNIYDCKVRKIMGLLGQKPSKPMDVGLKTFTALDGIHVYIPSLAEAQKGVSLLPFSVRRFCNTRNIKNETSSHPMSYIYETHSSNQGEWFTNIHHGRSSLQPFTLLL
ncbi:MAG: hypothetical protein IKQ77_06140, partial [Prevotella sp.]|nr:hypothetical protein [Prevotella sp.]